MTTVACYELMQNMRSPIPLTIHSGSGPRYFCLRPFTVQACIAQDSVKSRGLPPRSASHCLVSTNTENLGGGFSFEKSGSLKVVLVRLLHTFGLIVPFDGRMK